MKPLAVKLFAWIAVLTSTAGVLLLALFLVPLVPSLSINNPAWIKLSQPWLPNLLLILLFGLQHSVMARPWFKQWIGRRIPHEAERSVYVFASGLVLGVFPVLWQPMTGTIWWVEHPAGQIGIYVLFALGLLLTLAAVIAIDAMDLIGFRQAGVVQSKPMTFKRSWLHNQVRHPIYTGLILVCWATPFMTTGHFCFASLMTIYIRIGIYFEERHLIRTFGIDYEHYRKEVPMLFPWLFRKQ